MQTVMAIGMPGKWRACMAQQIALCDTPLGVSQSERLCKRHVG
eukprot:COSAG01_NODE_41617_length_449_cov_0.862857_2_plen_42_part_01